MSTVHLIVEGIGWTCIASTFLLAIFVSKKT